jgi:hypothetical protein
MTGDCHVRFYESRGLRRPRLLAGAKRAACEKQARRRHAAKNAAARKHREGVARQTRVVNELGAV